jgi:hypothetical protein
VRLDVLFKHDGTWVERVGFSLLVLRAEHRVRIHAHY